MSQVLSGNSNCFRMAGTRGRCGGPSSLPGTDVEEMEPEARSAWTFGHVGVFDSLLLRVMGEPEEGQEAYSEPHCKMFCQPSVQ